jgi:hypothetical protein
VDKRYSKNTSMDVQYENHSWVQYCPCLLPFAPLYSVLFDLGVPFKETSLSWYPSLRRATLSGGQVNNPIILKIRTLLNILTCYESSMFSFISRTPGMD